MTSQGAILALALKLLDAQRSIKNIEVLAAQFLELRLGDAKNIPEAIVEVIHYLALGESIMENLDVIESLDLSPQEKAAFKHAFEQRKNWDIPNPENKLFIVVYRCKGGLGFVKVYCIATDHDNATMIAASELKMLEIYTDRLMRVEVIKWPPTDRVKHNYDLMSEVVSNRSVEIEFLPVIN